MKKLILIALIFLGTAVQAQEMKLLGYDTNGKPLYGYSITRTQQGTQYGDYYSQVPENEYQQQPVYTQPVQQYGGANYSYTPQNTQKTQVQRVAKQAVMNTATSAIYGNYSPHRLSLA